MASGVTVRGVPEVLAAFQRLGDEFKGDALMSGALVGAEVLKTESKRICPVDTGNLRASITSAPGSVSLTRAEVEIGYGTQAPYGKYVELGTSRAAAQPFLRPPLVTHRAAAEAAVAGAMKRVLSRVG